MSEVPLYSALDGPASGAIRPVSEPWASPIPGKQLASCTATHGCAKSNLVGSFLTPRLFKAGFVIFSTCFIESVAKVE